MFIPAYGELFVSNVNAGFGFEAQYYLEDKFDFKGQFRKAYSRKFDLEREIAESNVNVISNEPNVFTYFELGGTYHVVDRLEDTETKMVLYSKNFKGNKWAAKVPEHIKVPSKVRKVYGARLGGFSYRPTTDLNRAMEEQNIEALLDQNQMPLDSTMQIFGNVSVPGAYIGGSMSWIKNFAIKPDRTYSTLVTDLIFTAYLDFIFAPSVDIDDIFFQDRIISTEPIETSNIGFRVGMEGKFNRTLGWAYGAELGVRPGVESRGFYAVVKISLPVYGTDLNYEKEAFGK